MKCAPDLVHVALPLALALAGCGRVYSYPEPEQEHTAALCSDGEDNDYDGQADCDDTDCNGFCTEESAEECRDGRDNDGDGLVDAADPRCWLKQPPQTKRCAEASGADIVNNFDTGFVTFLQTEGTWHGWGAGGGTVAPSRVRRRDGERRDWALLVPGVAVRDKPFSGSWQDFALSFDVALPHGARMRAGIVPIHLVSTQGAPSPGAKTALASVAIDATRSPATLSITVEEAEKSVALPFNPPSCRLDPCGGFWRVAVAGNAAGLGVRVTDPEGGVTELVGPAPVSGSVPTARLVLWGDPAPEGTAAVFDDLALNVEPEWPCGFAVPQIPGKSCDLADELGAFGQTVSVARSSAGEYCALVAASPADPTAVPSVPPPQRLTAWASGDGKIWTLAASDVGAPPEPETSALIGAGVAADETGLHAVVARRDQGGTRLDFVDAESCEHWGPASPGPLVFEDAEAPSYVITGARHDALFTRPAAAGAARTLWRVARGTTAADPEPLAALPAGVGAPVSITRIGRGDVVLAYPRSDASGVGLLVAGADLGSWDSVTPNAILGSPPKLDVYGGAGRIAFDDGGFLAASLAWDQDGGFLIYSGRATSGDIASSGRQPSLAVGTAHFAAAGAPLPVPVVPPERCGDGTCDDDEGCATCALDCACSGTILLEDVFDASRAWQVISTDPEPAGVEYLSVEPPGLSFLEGGPTWSALPLDLPLDGDFDLSFDLRLPFLADENTTWPTCSYYLGLGTVPELTPTGDIATSAGLFARFQVDWSCGSFDQFFATPVVLSGGGAVSETSAPCAAEQALATSTPHHFLLERRGSTVTLSTPRRDGCGRVEQVISYSGALPPLPALLVGSGAAPLPGCPLVPTQTALVIGGTLSHVELRLAVEPDRCPKGSERCAGASEQPVCVDTSQSAEHCGSCDIACGMNETCEDGRCTCADQAGIVLCDGECVDSLTSGTHCGGCNHACDGPCVRGRCAVIAEGCEIMGVLPPEGGSLVVTAAPGPSVAPICDALAFAPALFLWQPDLGAVGTFQVPTGFVTVDAAGVPSAAVLGITDPVCSVWSACSRPADTSSRSQLRFPLGMPGSVYAVAVGFTEPPAEGQAMTITVGVAR